MKITMNLTERDAKNTEKLTARLHSRSKAANREYRVVGHGSAR